jgi:hypothetical protein
MRRIRISAHDLKLMGASQKALDFYSSTDPLDIFRERGGFTVTGCFEASCDSEAELLTTLEDWADACEEDTPLF